MAKSKRYPARKTLQEIIDADVAFLEKATAGAPIGDPTDEEMREIYDAQRRIRARRIRERSARVSPATSSHKS